MIEASEIPRTLAVDDSGTEILWQGDGDLYRGRASGTTQLAASAVGRLASIAFLPGTSRALLADATNDRILLLEESGATIVLAAETDGVREPIAVSSSADGVRAIWASPRGVGSASVAGGSAEWMDSPVALNGLIPAIGTNSAFVASAEPMWLWDGDSEPARFVQVASPVPAGAGITAATEGVREAVDQTNGAVLTTINPSALCATPPAAGAAPFLTTDTNLFLWVRGLNVAINDGTVARWTNPSNQVTETAKQTARAAGTVCFTHTLPLTANTPRGTWRVQVFNDANRELVSQAFVVAARPVFAEAVRPSIGSGEQGDLVFRLTEAPAANLTGTVTMLVGGTIFNPPTGGSTYDFRILSGNVLRFAAAQQQSDAVRIQLGTVAATVTFSVAITQIGTRALTPPVTQAIAGYSFAASPPSNLQATVRRINDTTMQVSVRGVASRRRISRATFQFFPRSGRKIVIDSQPAPIDLNTPGAQWFSTSQAAALGGQFQYNQTFTVSGGVDKIGTVNVVLADDGVGSSASVSSGVP
ncbi:MAG: hypothetical protein U0Q16_25710 [Bryobacteraceae bacterium]